MMTLQIELSDDLEARLTRLVEAGVFRSREEAILMAAKQFLEQHPIEDDRADVEDAFIYNRDFFEQRKKKLRAQYKGEFVAIWDKQVVDHDTGRTRLAERVYRRFGFVPIYIDQPLESPARFYMSSPSLGEFC